MWKLIIMARFIFYEFVFNIFFCPFIAQAETNHRPRLSPCGGTGRGLPFYWIPRMLANLIRDSFN